MGMHDVLQTLQSEPTINIFFDTGHHSRKAERSGTITDAPEFHFPNVLFRVVMQKRDSICVWMESALNNVDQKN
jgi:hypothetical protein